MHVCEQARCARSAGNSAIDNLCVIIIMNMIDKDKNPVWGKECGRQMSWKEMTIGSGTVIHTEHPYQLQFWAVCSVCNKQNRQIFQNCIQGPDCFYVQWKKS